MGTRTETTTAPVPHVAVDGLRDRQVPLFVRIRADLPAVLVDLTFGHAVQGRLENLSVGGMFFRGADTLAVGARVLCALVVTENGRQEELYASGTVVHRHDHGVGIAFDEVTARAFTAISRMIADAGCFRMRPIEPCCPAAGPEPPRPGPKSPGDGCYERRRPRPRKARMNRWAATHTAA